MTAMNTMGTLMKPTDTTSRSAYEMAFEMLRTLAPNETFDPGAPAEELANYMHKRGFHLENHDGNWLVRGEEGTVAMVYRDRRPSLDKASLISSNIMRGAPRQDTIEVTDGIKIELGGLDIAPKWIEIMPLYLETYVQACLNGNGERQAAVRQEFERMAKLADLYSAVEMQR